MEALKHHITSQKKTKNSVCQYIKLIHKRACTCNDIWNNLCFQDNENIWDNESNLNWADVSAQLSMVNYIFQCNLFILFFLSVSWRKEVGGCIQISVWWSGISITFIRMLWIFVIFHFVWNIFSFHGEKRVFLSSSLHWNVKF